MQCRSIEGSKPKSLSPTEIDPYMRGGGQRCLIESEVVLRVPCGGPTKGECKKILFCALLIVFIYIPLANLESLIV